MQNSLQLVKYCRICGDKASGFKYRGLCCESCKMFYLRNAANDKLSCLKSGNCEINFYTRKNCAKCRLEKCFANGMTLKSNRKSNKKETESNSSFDQNMRTVLESIDFDFEHFEKINFEYPNPLKLNLPQLPYVVARRNNSELIAPERQVISNIQAILCETFVDESKLRIVGCLENKNDLPYYMALYARRIVRFCKSFPAFKQICPTDQLAILKPFFYEILLTRIAYIYDRAKHGHPVIEDETAGQALFVEFDKFDSLIENEPMVEEAIKFLFTVQDGLENDFTIRDLLLAILLFKSRKNLSNPEFVHYQYSLYCRLLRKYLEHKYHNVCHANKKYQTLIQITDAFDHQTKLGRDLIKAEFDINKIPHVVHEYMDL